MGGKTAIFTQENSMNENNSSNGSRSLVNFILYTLCVTSLGFSVYTSFRQSHLEDRVRHMRHLDDRITILEAKIHHQQQQKQQLQQQQLQQQQQQTVSFSQPATAEFTDVANVMRKLSLQVAGIQRLRRDVSHLQVARRERQASIQQSPECVCPPGMFK